jgi:acyl-lipid omega-6 desaturase (Delta-12 desaturase)
VNFLRKKINGLPGANGEIRDESVFHSHLNNHRMPFYRLPELCRDIPEFRQARTTSLHPLEILRRLRLKVWCVETQRMIGVQEL